MSTSRRIRTPLKRHWKFFRVRALPFLIWLAAAGGAAVLWRQRSTRLDTPAVLEAHQVIVAPLEPGTLVALTAELYDSVAAGQPVATLDDAAVRAALAVAEAEVQRLKAELAATEQQLKEDARLRELDLFTSNRDYAMRVERLRIEKLDRMIELENDQVMLVGHAATLRRQKALRTKNVIGEQEYDDARFLHDALEKKIAATKAAVEVFDGRIREALGRKDVPATISMQQSIAVALAPVREELGVQLKLVDEIQVQRKALVLTSPLDGVVTAVYRREGEMVMAGEPILTVSDPRSMRIVSLVEQGTFIQPKVGMLVEVRRRTTPIQVAQSWVLRVSPQIERIPRAAPGGAAVRRREACASNASDAERAALGGAAVQRWGQRVLIDVQRVLIHVPPSMLVPPAEALPGAFVPPRPGEVLDVRYFAPRFRTRPPRVSGAARAAS